MAFRKTRHAKRKLMLFPLMDMFFILLLFFLVNIGAQEDGGEKAYSSTVPTRGIGEAQILLQMISPSQVLWLDNTVFHDGNWSTGFPSSYVISVATSTFRSKLVNFRETYGRCIRQNVLTVIRAPNDLDYGDVEALQDTLAAAFRESMPGYVLKRSLIEAGALPVVDSVNVIGSNEVVLRW